MNDKENARSRCFFLSTVAILMSVSAGGNAPRRFLKENVAAAVEDGIAKPSMQSDVLPMEIDADLYCNRSYQVLIIT